MTREKTIYIKNWSDFLWENEINELYPKITGV